MSFSCRAINPPAANKTKTFAGNFWNGVFFGTAIWTFLIFGTVVADYALKTIY